MFALATEAGELARPLDYEGWSAREGIRLEGDKLVWPRRAKPKRIRPGKRMFEDFVSLGNYISEDEPHFARKVLRYAQTWGEMEICEHGRPISHKMGGEWSGNLNDLGCRVPPWSDDPDFKVEPVAYWRDLVLQFRAILRAAGLLHSNEIPLQHQLIECLPTAKNWGVDLDHLSQSRSNAWGFVVMSMRTLMSDAYLDLLPCLPRNSTGPRIKLICSDLIGSGLYSALVTQLMFVACRTDGMAICSSCGEPFFPSHLPRVKQRSYCENCRVKRKTPVRDAMREYRKRKKLAQELHFKGRSIAKIAEALSIPIDQVKRYLKPLQRARLPSKER
jgi:hypothetical protein